MRANTNKLALNRAEDVTGELKAKHVNIHEHTIFVDGTELSERREMEIISDGPSEGQLILKHTRRINGQEYTLHSDGKERPQSIQINRSRGVITISNIYHHILYKFA